MPILVGNANLIICTTTLRHIFRFLTLIIWSRFFWILTHTMHYKNCRSLKFVIPTLYGIREDTS